ncbi:MAG: xanthine dehydrogenase family protein molybdopterin-binding subunit, partial [Desulfocucumaceae bacterium]
MEKSGTAVGRSIDFVDAGEKVTGRARYLDDISLPGMLYGKILRSPYPHARIKGIDTARAAALPGVKAVITAADCPRIPFGLDTPDVYMLAVDKVRYVGDEVAAVAAVSEEVAEQALELISVDYDPLPGVYEPRTALAPGAPSVHEDRPGNIAKSYKIERGSVDEDFAG